MKRVRLAIVFFALLCGVGVGLLWSGLLSGPLMRAISAHVEGVTGFRLDVNGATRVALFPIPAIVAHDVSVVGPGTTEPALRVERVSLGLSLGELLRGRVHATEVNLRGPVLRLTAGTGTEAPNRDKGAAFTPSVGFDALTVENGSLMYRDVSENAEFRIDGLAAEMRSQGEDAPLAIEARGLWGGTALALNASLGSTSRALSGLATTIEVVVREAASGRSLLSLTARMQPGPGNVALGALDATMSAGRLRGSAVLDWSRRKPYLQADLAGEGVRVSLPFASARDASGGWNRTDGDLSALRLANAAVKLSARDLAVENVKLASAQVDTSLLDGVLSIAVSDAALYGGKGQGRLTVDAASQTPSHSLRLSLSKLDALPFFTDVFGLENVAGRLQADAILQAKGASPAAVAAGLGGTARITFEDGAIQGLGLEKTIRALPIPVAQGWALSTPERIPFGTFGMTFNIAEGRASTADLALNGPYMRATGKGTADVGAKTLDFTVEPTVAFPEAQGRGGRSVKLGIPILIQGAWSDPRISAPLERLLQNPEGTLRTLQSLGEGLLSESGRPAPPNGSGRGEDRSAPPTPGRARDQIHDIMRNLFGN